MFTIGENVNQMCKYIRTRPPGDLEPRTVTYTNHALYTYLFWLRDVTIVAMNESTPMVET